MLAVFTAGSEVLAVPCNYEIPNRYPLNAMSVGTNRPSIAWFFLEPNPDASKSVEGCTLIRYVLLVRTSLQRRHEAKLEENCM